MKAQAALVGAESTVHLDPVTAVDLHLTLIVDPRNAKHDHPFGLGDTLQDLAGAIPGVTLDDRPE